MYSKASGIESTEDGLAFPPIPAPWTATSKSTLHAPKRLATFDEHVSHKRAVARVYRNVPYRQLQPNGKRARNISLDVYEPQKDSEGDKRGPPVIVHIHGGGWLRGGRDKAFYGAPSICSAYASMGFVAVAPSYRLGQFPTFLEDVAAAIKWTLEELPRVVPDADVSRIVLSGHSAGAHIVALLLTDTSYFEAAGVVDVAWRIAGAVLISGIYTLKNPFAPAMKNWRNSIFQSLYVRRAFHEDDVAKASPMLLVCRKLLDPSNPRRLTREAHKALREVAKAIGTELKDVENEDDDDLSPEIRESLLGMLGASPAPRDVPILTLPIAIVNAAQDVGLDYDADRFANILSLARPPCAPPHTVIAPHTRHRNVCSLAEGHRAVADALTQLLTCAPSR